MGEHYLPTADQILGHMLRDSDGMLKIYLEYVLGLRGQDITDTVLYYRHSLPVCEAPVESTSHTMEVNDDRLVAMELVMEAHLSAHPELKKIWGRVLQTTEWLNRGLGDKLFLPTDLMHPLTEVRASFSLRGAYQISHHLNIGEMLPHALLGEGRMGDAVSVMTEKIVDYPNCVSTLDKIRGGIYIEYFLPSISQLNL